MSDDAYSWKTRTGKGGRLEWRGLPTYDADDAVRKLQPEQLGINYARKGNPGHGTALTHAERDMLSDVNAHINQLQEHHARVTGEVRKLLIEIGPAVDSEQKFLEAEQGFQEATKKLYTKFTTEQKGDISRLYETKGDLNAFRQNQKPKSLPTHPTYPTNKLLHLAWVVLAVGLEGIVNAAFFSDNPAGLLGGFVQAFLISVANVSLSFFIGYLFLREINHKSWLRKSAGIVLALVFSVLVILLHLSTGHYREALRTSGDAEFFSSFAFDPRTLQDMNSLVLIGIGIAISMFAMIKGFRFDDPYPGYGDVYRKYMDYEKKIAKEQMEYQLAVDTAHTEAVRKLRDIPKKLDLKEKELKHFEGEMKTYFRCVDLYLEQDSNTAKRLLTKFRESVEVVWGKPGSFPVSDELMNKALESIDPSELKAEIEGHLANCLGDLKASLQKYSREREAWAKELETERENHASRGTVERLFTEFWDGLGDGDKPNAGGQAGRPAVPEVR